MKYKALVFLILASISFFNPLGVLSLAAQRFTFYLAVAVAGAIAAFNGASLQRVQYPRVPFMMVLGGIAASIFCATAFHMQTIKISVLTTLPFLLSYSTFWIFMRLNVSRLRILHMYMVLCGIASLVYFANAATFPSNIFGNPILNEDTTRGIIRIPVVLIEMFPLLVFYAINRWLLEGKKKWLLMIAGASFMIILSVTRQIILVTFLLGVLFLFQNISWFKKIVLSVAMALIVIFVLPLIPMYNTMLEFSESQKEDNEETENIRITSWRYYTYENQENVVSVLLGNGMPALASSRWGIMFDSETQENGCFAADVGWAGFFWHFGLIATGGLLAMLIMGLAKPKPPSRQYLNYWIVFLLITGIASGPILYYWQIVSVMMVLYLVFKKDDDSDRDEDGEEIDEPEPVEQKRQLRAGYPQLPKR